METYKHIKIFVGSPSDTLDERNIIDQVLDEFNKTLGTQNNIHFDSFRWENDVVPAIGKDPQDVINRQSGQYDFFVGLMWKKFGDKTERADSPTIEEYQNAYKSYKENGNCKGIAMFFSKKAIPANELDFPVLEQLGKIRKFKDKISKEDGVFYKEYDGPEEFKEVFKINMYQLFSKTFCADYRKETKLPVLPTAKTETAFDKNTKIIFDSLLMNANVGKFKTAFVESCIFIYLNDVKAASVAQISNHLKELFSKEDNRLYNNVISKLSQKGDIISDGGYPKKFRLSPNVESQISDIQRKSEDNEQELAQCCYDICNKYNLSLDFHILRDFVLELFDKNYELDTRELSKGIISRDNSIKRIFNNLIEYIKSRSGLPQAYVSDIAKEIIEVFCNNPTLYKCSTSKMFLSLFQSDKLEEYMSITKRHLLFDTQVLLRFVCAIYDSDEVSSGDSLYLTCKNLWRVIRSDQKFVVHTTEGYVKEVADHLVQARDLSRFLNLGYLHDLGPSKNVFFNHYLAIRDSLESGSFEEYVSELLNIDESDVFASFLFDKAYEKLYAILSELGFHIESIPLIDKYDEYKIEYERVLAYENFTAKSYIARTNDLHTIILLSGLTSTFDTVPYLITLDRSFVNEREALTRKFKEMSDWYIYSPQKIANTISVMNLQVNPKLIDDNIISLAEANFNTSNETISFLDLLSSFIDKDSNISDWKLAQKLSELRKSLRDTSYNFNDDKVYNLPIDEFLLLLCSYYNSPGSEHDFSEFQTLMVDNKYADELSKLFVSEIGNFKGEGGKIESSVVKKFNSLIDNRLQTNLKEK